MSVLGLPNMDSYSSSEDSTTSIAAICARCRFAAAVAVVIAEEAEGVVPARRRHADRKNWKVHVCIEGPRVFRRLYRMDVYYFNDLLSRIKSKLETRNEEVAMRSSISVVCPEIRLNMTLPYLISGKI